jgi:hypothetical protein
MPSELQPRCVRDILVCWNAVDLGERVQPESGFAEQ